MEDDKINELSTFQANLKSLGLGGLLRRADKKHRKIIKGVLDTGKKGQLTIKVNYKSGGMNSIVVTSDVTAKVPEDSLSAVEMYADHRGMFEENPDQLDFENVRQIDDKPKQVKQV